MAVTVRQTEFGHLLKAAGAGIPAVLRDLVTADVDIFGGEDVHHLGQDVLKKRKGPFLSDTEHVLFHAPGIRDFVRASGAAELGIGCKRAEHMTGKVEFWNHCDAALGGIGYHFAHLITGIVASVVLRTQMRRVIVNLGPVADRPHFCEAGVSHALETPPLVFRKMPVEHIHLVHRHYVKASLYLVHAVEMTADVYQDTAVGEARTVTDTNARKDIIPSGTNPSIYGHRKHLAQGLDRIHEAAVGRGTYHG